MPIHYESKKISQKISRKILENHFFKDASNAQKMLRELLYDIIMSVQCAIIVT